MVAKTIEFLFCLLLIASVWHNGFGAVRVWLSTGDQENLLKEQTQIPFQKSAADTDSRSDAVVVSDCVTYQTIDGFGAAMTGSAAHVFQKLSADERQTLFKDLFTDSGIRLTFLRHSMGASDFTPQGDYTYDDVPEGETDEKMERFTIEKEKVDVIPMLKEVLTHSPNIKIMGSPWSSPAWMKEKFTVKGSRLLPKYYDAYSLYFLKYLQAYAKEKIPIYAVTLQNEPQFEAHYLGLYMHPNDQAALLKSMGPALAKAGFGDVKLLVYDHNWNRPDYPITVLDDPEAAKWAAGSAFHGYGGCPTGQSVVHYAHPDKGIWHTEQSGYFPPGNNYSNYDFGGDLRWHAQNIIIGTTRNWGKSALEWNLALDEKNGPTNNGCLECRGVVTIETNKNNNIIRNIEYYVLGHASKFVDPGAVRIDSVVPFNEIWYIDNVAFRNPDGSIVVIAINVAKWTTTFKITWGKQYFEYTLPVGGVATFKWSGEPGPECPASPTTAELTTKPNTGAALLWGQDRKFLALSLALLLFLIL